MQFTKQRSKSVLWGDGHRMYRFVYRVGGLTGDGHPKVFGLHPNDGHFNVSEAKTSRILFRNSWPWWTWEIFIGERAGVDPVQSGNQHLRLYLSRIWCAAPGLWQHISHRIDGQASPLFGAPCCVLCSQFDLCVKLAFLIDIKKRRSFPTGDSFMRVISYKFLDQRRLFSPIDLLHHHHKYKMRETESVASNKRSKIKKPAASL